MNILVVGVFDVPWSTNISMANALENLGHNVSKFSYREIARTTSSSHHRLRKMIERQINRFSSKAMPDSIMNKINYFICGRSEISRQLLKNVQSNKYDLVLMTKTDSMDYRIIKKINSYSTTWYYFMDWIATAVEIHAVKYAQNSTFSSTNCTDVLDLFEKNQANAFYISQGVDTSIFFPTSVEKDIDVCFVGVPRDARLLLLNYLEKNNINVKIYGPNTKNGPIYSDDLTKVYQRSKIVLNTARCLYGFSNRVFQAMGCGAFLLTEYCKDLDRIFIRKKYNDWYSTKEECLELIKYYLKHDLEREQIAKSGCYMVKTNYSWENIMEKIIKTVQEV